ncbi:uncharacterized protein TNCV_4977091 [Trichonephila clavipes]|nr:uncharacterized protein TNCV_4977091 [Trichonephila clavipes]
MAPGNHCLSGNTCGCRMSWTYLWAVMCGATDQYYGYLCIVGNDTPYHHTSCGSGCRYKVKAGLRCSPRGLRTRTRLSSLMRLNLDSSLKTTLFHSAAVQFPRAQHQSKRSCRWVVVKGSKRKGRRDPKCPSIMRLRMVRVDTGSPNEGDPVPGWWPMKQLAVRMHFLRYGGLL